jgi:hypothetical protein
VELIQLLQLKSAVSTPSISIDSIAMFVSRDVLSSGFTILVYSQSKE